MTIYKTAKVDPTKPMELDDGTPVTLVRGPYGSCGRSRVDVRLPANGHYLRHADRPSASKTWTYDLNTGVWAGGNATAYKVLRNVAAAVANPYTLFSGKKLKTRSGTPAEFVTVHEGKAIFKLTYPNAGWGSQSVGFVERNLDGTVSGATTYGGTTRSDPDDIVVVEPRVTTYRNVYADGTVGETAHKTATAVVNGIKSGKVRVGYLTQVHEGAELISAVLTATTPSRRDGTKAFPKA